MLNYYDEDSLLNPKFLLSKSKVRLPETAIVAWHGSFSSQALERGANPVWNFTGGTRQTVYSLENNGEEYSYAHIALGGPIVATFMEEMKVLGTKNFIFLGSCGVLDKDIKDELIVPVAALRDEGTSWHYIKSREDFVQTNTAWFTQQVLDELQVPYVSGKTWTTDTVYRETAGARKEAVEKGCICVDMECASIMAVAQYLDVNAYQFFFTADKLESEKWKKGKLGNINRSENATYFEIALKIAEKIKKTYSA